MIDFACHNSRITKYFIFFKKRSFLRLHWYNSVKQLSHLIPYLYRNFKIRQNYTKLLSPRNQQAFTYALAVDMRDSLRVLKAWSHQPTLTPIDADSSVRTSLFSLCYCLLRQNPSLLSVLLATVINRMQAMAPVWRSSYPIYAGGAWSRLSDQVPHNVIIRYMQNG